MQGDVFSFWEKNKGWDGLPTSDDLQGKRLDSHSLSDTKEVGGQQYEGAPDDKKIRVRE